MKLVKNVRAESFQRAIPANARYYPLINTDITVVALEELNFVHDDNDECYGWKLGGWMVYNMSTTHVVVYHQDYCNQGHSMGVIVEKLDDLLKLINNEIVCLPFEKVSDIQDPDVKEAVQATLMMRSAENFMKFAQARIDKLTEEQVNKAVEHVRNLSTDTLYQLC